MVGDGGAAARLTNVFEGCLRAVDVSMINAFIRAFAHDVGWMHDAAADPQLAKDAQGRITWAEPLWSAGPPEKPFKKLPPLLTFVTLHIPPPLLRPDAAKRALFERLAAMREQIASARSGFERQLRQILNAAPDPSDPDLVHLSDQIRAELGLIAAMRTESAFDSGAETKRAQRTAIASLPNVDPTGDTAASFEHVCRSCSDAMAALEEPILSHFKDQLLTIEADKDHQLSEARASIVLHLQRQIDELASKKKSFGAQANEILVNELREVLKERRLSVMCKCGFPGLPYFQSPNRGGTKEGAFQIIHHCKGGKKAFHGGMTTFPRYAIIHRPSSLLDERPPPPSRKK